MLKEGGRACFQAITLEACLAQASKHREGLLLPPLLACSARSQPCTASRSLALAVASLALNPAPCTASLSLALALALLQFHVWLASPGPDAQPTRLVVLVPGYPLVNFLLCTAIYVYISRRLFLLTGTLKVGARAWVGGWGGLWVWGGGGGTPRAFILPTHGHAQGAGARGVAV